jgi:hypothetical protein
MQVRFDFESVEKRDRYFEALHGMGYTVTRYQPKTNCRGRIAASDGSTVHYNAVEAAVIVDYQDEGRDCFETIELYAREHGASSA